MRDFGRNFEIENIMGQKLDVVCEIRGQLARKDALLQQHFIRVACKTLTLNPFVGMDPAN